MAWLLPSPSFRTLKQSTEWPLEITMDNCITVLYTVGMRKKLTALRLKPEQIRKLGKLAAREDVSVSWLIRRAIDEFLKRKK
jgi:hypothetical protein